MNTYEIVLACWFCGKEVSLGFVQATSAYDAKQVASLRWPDARYEEMIARIRTPSRGFRNQILTETVAEIAWTSGVE